MAVTAEAAPRTVVPERHRLVDALFAPTDIAILVYFRVAFGVLIAWEAVRGLLHHQIPLLLHANVLFTYWPFTFVKLMPSPLMYGVEIMLVVAGVFMALGFYYRLSAIAVFVGSTYLFLLDSGRYLNHIYLVCLLAFLMIFLPANRRWSLDARFDPNIRRDEVPAWTLWLLRFQIAVPYFFGGLAKLNGDWFRGQPLHSMLLVHRDFPLLGHYFNNRWFFDFLNWGSLLLDLLVVLALLNRYTRVPAYMAAIAFHLMNARFFHIGIFPFLMIAATALFFPADWPRRVVNDARTRPLPRRFRRFVIGFVIGAALALYLPNERTLIFSLVGGIGGGVVGYYFEIPPPRKPRVPAPRAIAAPHKKLVVGILAVWVALQVLLPLRHFVLPGNVYWTESGERFAWFMMLRNKAGTTTFVLRNPQNGKTQDIDPRDFLQPIQMVFMTGSPDLTVQFAHYLSDRAQREEHLSVRPQVFVRTMLSLNRRPPQPFIDPTVDLARVQRPFIKPPKWIIPLRPRTSAPYQAPSQGDVDKSASASAG
jgi:vitamin K-dependent gamma-carboxylase